MKCSTHPKLIGILGGMGPLATVDFLEKVIRATPASQDQDHVPMIVHHVPQIPNRNLAVLDGHDAPFEPMLSGLRTLQRAGADAIAIPCNTAHAWFDRLAQETPVPLIHIADAVAQNVQKRGSGNSEVVLLATRGTIAAGIYTSRVNGIADRIVRPEEAIQVRIERVILDIKTGRINEAREEASRLAECLLSGHPARLLLLACTELPIAFETSRFSSHLIDSSQALAEACIACSIGLQGPDVPPGQQPPTSAGP